MSLLRWVKAHPKIVGVTAVAGTAAGAGAVARQQGWRIPLLSPLIDKLWPPPSSTQKPGAGSSGGQTTQPPPDTSGGRRPTSTGVPAYKFTIDPTKLPPKGPQGSKRKTSAYDAWVVQALNQIDGAGLSAGARSSSGQFQTAVKKFQTNVGPAPGLRVDGQVGPQTENALVQLGASAPPGNG